jgi:hypothetical protein
MSKGASTGRVQEMAESSPDRFSYERKIADRFGGQQEWELIAPPAPPAQPEIKLKINDAAKLGGPHAFSEQAQLPSRTPLPTSPQHHPECSRRRPLSQLPTNRHSRANIDSYKSV